MRIYPKIFWQRNCAENCHNIFCLQPLLMKSDNMALGIWIMLSFASMHDNEYTLCAYAEKILKRRHLFSTTFIL